jgi:hypothetical protein
MENRILKVIFIGNLELLESTFKGFEQSNYSFDIISVISEANVRDDYFHGIKVIPLNEMQDIILNMPYDLIFVISKFELQIIDILTKLGVGQSIIKKMNDTQPMIVDFLTALMTYIRVPFNLYTNYYEEERHNRLSAFRNKLVRKP